MNAPTTNKSVISWIEDKIALVNPDKVVWIDGSQEQIGGSWRRGLRYRRTY